MEIGLVFNWTIKSSIMASLFVILILLVKYALRNKLDAKWQYAIWMLLIIRLLIPYDIQSPWSIYSLLPNNSVTTPIINQAIISEPDTTISGEEIRLTQDQSSINKAEAPISRDLSYGWILAILWLVGVIILAILTLATNLKFYLLVRREPLATDAGMSSLMQECARKLGIRKGLPIICMNEIDTPCLYGIISPKLLLPKTLINRLNNENMKHIFIHELSHYKRNDILINWLAVAAQIVHWFNPLIWYSFARMREDCELACDADALGSLRPEEYQSYGLSIISLVTPAQSPWLPGTTGFFGNKNNLQIKRRLARIKKFGKSSIKWSLLGAVLIGVIAFGTFTSAKVDANPSSSLGASSGQGIAPTKVGDTSSGITIEDISGATFKGKVMLIKDPKRVKLSVTNKIGVTGERVSDLVKDVGAIAGINAGGFYDPNGKGNGAFPEGLTMQTGKLVHNNVGDTAVNIAGFNDMGKLILGEMTATQLKEQNMREVVSFGPNLIVDGNPMVKGDGGWGIAPRTGIGQMGDGTVIFVVIDGRQPTWSIGATLRELMLVFEDYHAVNAVNLDGGSSSELFYNGKVINRFSNVFGERHIPTAFVVAPQVTK